MFNPEKILGGLITGGVKKRSGLDRFLPGGAALTLLGVAVAAVEHYMDKAPTSRPGPPPPPPQNAPPAPPGHSSVAGPPVPPSSQGSGPPPPPAARMTQSTEADHDPILLIRAMIAAANADGVIDQQERERILGKLETVRLSEEEHSFLARELLSPANVEGIVSLVKNREMAQQVYAVSLLAIDVDTEAEREYMETLARKLDLDEANVNRIRAELGIGNK